MTCKHETHISPQVISDEGMQCQPETASCLVDIDLHRYKCTLCGYIGYYSIRARRHFEGIILDPMIAESNERYLARTRIS